VRKAGWKIEQFRGDYYIKMPGTLPPKPSVVYTMLLVLFLFYVLLVFVVSALFSK